MYVGSSVFNSCCPGKCYYVNVLVSFDMSHLTSMVDISIFSLLLTGSKYSELCFAFGILYSISYL